jgi:hypothetical protein
VPLLSFRTAAHASSACAPSFGAQEIINEDGVNLPSEAEADPSDEDDQPSFLRPSVRPEDRPA